MRIYHSYSKLGLNPRMIAVSQKTKIDSTSILEKSASAIYNALSFSRCALLSSSKELSAPKTIYYEIINKEKNNK